jgi:hypothetical protein
MKVKMKGVVDSARVVCVLREMLKAADQLMGEATGNRVVQDWRQVNDALCAAGNLVRELEGT